MIVGTAVTVLSLTLPLVKGPQELTWRGPQVQFNPERTYWIDTRITPPIDKGAIIDLTFNVSKVGAAAILVYPSTPDGEPLGRSLLAETLRPEQTRLSTHLRAETSSHYMIVVTVWNNTYSIRVASVWSPFSEWKQNLIYGVIIAAGGAVLFYYERIVFQRLKLYQKTLKGGS